ncbi:unnamed protein product [Bursaphelenchus okinawaensis]|uniref:Kinesin-like protein n=1 Tax=Bursaphelenchus okinawaensis TaxID=465554 RepID=A0A811KAI4_9BILA|nr:unnamed protein product [Bursaphelenchus okinawaensis]CAG9097513.1 unnamed protein product [Bursaphelenchus okinawaensis]
MATELLTNMFDNTPTTELNSKDHWIRLEQLQRHSEDKDSLIRNLETIIDELEGELGFLRKKHNESEELLDEDGNKRVLKGISYLSVDFGRLSAENLELRSQLRQAHLELRMIREKNMKTMHYSTLPISVDSAIQTDTESWSGATTPSIPADPISDETQLLALRQQLQLINEENSNLTLFAKDLKRELNDTFENLRCSLAMEIPKHFSKIQKRFQEEVELRRALHNALIELRGNIRVFCRVKPGPSGVVTLDPLDVDVITINIDNTNKRFLFDKIFGQEASQADVFDEVSPLVQSCLDGKNVSIFAYGHTGSGKTFTMEGPESDPGISRRVGQEIFALLEEKSEYIECNVTASIIEIYNEKIRDLLESDSTSSQKVQVRTDSEGRAEVRGVQRVEISSVKDLHELIKIGHKNRSTATTALNEASSRSHALVMLTLKMTDKDSGNEWTGRLNLVDLAGSERVARSQVVGAQLNEAKFINKSLSELGNVVLALRKNLPHVPFRNCLLTRILEDSLVGDSKTLLILQVTTDESSAKETLSSLNFAEKISNITRRPKCAAVQRRSNLV